MRKYVVSAALLVLCSLAPSQLWQRISSTAGLLEQKAETKIGLAQGIVERRTELVQHSMLLALQNPPAGAPPQQRRAIDTPAVYHIAGMDRVKPHRESYKTAEGEPLRLDLYRPLDLQPGEKRPLVIFANWKRTSMTEWVLMVSWGQLVASTGLNAIVYQSAADPDADLNDLVAHVRKHAARLQIDAERIGIVTMSGNTVTALPFMTQPERGYIRCGVIYYGMIQRPLVRRDLPLLIVRAGLEADLDLNQRLDDYMKKLLEQNAPVTLINYQNGHHSFDLRDDTDRSREIIKETLAFLKRHLQPIASNAATPERAVGAATNKGSDNRETNQ
jgi:hypothetical protein